jgi:hypothetical protein
MLRGVMLEETALEILGCISEEFIIPLKVGLGEAKK